MKTIGMNHKVLEQEFIEDNSHCHLCSADMAGPCAYLFKEWMSCASSLDKSDPNDPRANPQLNHKECQGVLNNYVYVNYCKVQKVPISFLHISALQGTYLFIGTPHNPRPMLFHDDVGLDITHSPDALDEDCVGSG